MLLESCPFMTLRGSLGEGNDVSDKRPNVLLINKSPPTFRKLMRHSKKAGRGWLHVPFVLVALV